MANILALGDSLGALNTMGNEISYAIRLDGDIIYLSKNEHDIWRWAKAALYSLDKFPDLVDKSSKDIDHIFSQLKEKGIVIEWPDELNDAFMNEYIFLPMGFTIGTNEKNQQQICDYIDATPNALSEIPFFIWSEANAVVTLKLLKHELIQVFHMKNKEAEKVLQEWIPILMANGLGSLLPLSKE